KASITAIAVTSDTTARPVAGRCRKGPRRRSNVRLISALNRVTASGDVPEPFELLLDVRLAVAFLDRGDLLLQHARDELLDRRVAGEVGAAFSFSQERFVEFDARSKHSPPLGIG